MCVLYLIIDLCLLLLAGRPIRSPDEHMHVHTPAGDTLVNYCLLMQMGYYYGQKFADRKSGWKPEEITYFNERWVNVFNIPVYQKGVADLEFIRSSRFSEGNEAAFPPSKLYPPGSPDTYMIFHLAKEIGMVKSPVFQRCPSCVEMSISKIAAYVKVTPLEHTLLTKWPYLSCVPRITTEAEADTVWNFLQCIFPDTLLDPKTTEFRILQPQISCRDTILVGSEQDIAPEFHITWGGCAAEGDTVVSDPELISGKPQRKNAVYRIGITASNVCGMTAACSQYFVIH